jgi:hypothetical protein
MTATTKRVVLRKTVRYQFTLDIPNSSSLTNAQSLAYAEGTGGPLNSNNDIGKLLAGSSAMNGSITTTADWAVNSSSNIEPYFMWTPSYQYAVGDRVSPTANSNKLYTVANRSGYNTLTTGSSEPNWPTSVNGTVNNGGITFTCIAKF